MHGMGVHPLQPQLLFAFTSVGIYLLRIGSYWYHNTLHHTTPHHTTPHHNTTHHALSSKPSRFICLQHPELCVCGIFQGTTHRPHTHPTTEC